MKAVCKMKNPENLRELLLYSEEKYRDRPAFLLKDEEGSLKTVTYEEFRTDTDRLSAALCDMGLKGKKIALMGENSYEWCLGYMSAAGTVGVVVPLDKEMPKEELENIISFAQLEGIICDKKTSTKVISACHFSKRDIKVICTDNVNNTVFFGDLLRKGEELLKGEGDYFYENPDKDKMAVLLFTSGTTGMAKGVMLSHYNLCSDLICVSKSVNVEKDDVSLSVLPLHHTYEAIAFLMIIYSGGSISFCKSIRTLRDDFSFYRPTVFVTVPLMLEKLHRRIMGEIDSRGKRKKLQIVSVVSAALSEEKKKKLFSDIHSFFGGRLKKIVVGAAALQQSVAEDFFLFGIPVIIGYGLTECSPIVICNTLENITFDSIGRPLENVEVKIVDRDNKDIGEICVRGPMVMLGYYKNKRATDEVLIDGFLHTGDLGYKDKNGNYHITGRKKNVIVTRNGKNVYPEEVEYYLLKNSVISDCMVYAEDDLIVSAQIIPDEEEIRKKLKKNELTKTDIDKAVTEAVRSTNRKLPSYKNIKKVTVRNKDFVRTTTHKIKRGEEENRG